MIDRKRILAALLACLLLSALFCGVGCDSQSPENAVKLSFQSAAGYDYLKTLDGKTVSLNGYMATSSPVDGSFMFLMNLPYQNCPFCVPNTSQLSNTMEVYPKKGESFSYTTQAVKVVGKLVVSPSEDEPFTDMYGYQFTCKIVDATYTVIRAEELSADIALWQRVAESEVITDIYAMYDYLHFLCAWNTYFCNPYTDENGTTDPGYYLFPEDAKYYIYTDGSKWNYGYQAGYFDKIVADIRAIDATALEDLVINVRQAEALAAKAIAELENGNYTYEYKYPEQFKREDYVYTLTNGETLSAEMNAIYTAFSDWLGNWEL